LNTDVSWTNQLVQRIHAPRVRRCVSTATFDFKTLRDKLCSPNPKMADDESHSSVGDPCHWVTGSTVLKLLRLGLSLLYKWPFVPTGSIYPDSFDSSCSTLCCDLLDPPAACIIVDAYHNLFTVVELSSVCLTVCLTICNRLYRNSTGSD
jgi:hypothetical protein